MSATAQKNTSHSRMRLKNSFGWDAYGIMSATEVSGHTMTRMRPNLLARLGLSSTSHTSQGKC